MLEIWIDEPRTLDDGWEEMYIDYDEEAIWDMLADWAKEEVSNEARM